MFACYAVVIQCRPNYLTMVIGPSKSDIARITEGDNLIQLKKTLQKQRIDD